MPVELGDIRIEPLTDLHRRDRFRCANPQIENFCRGGLADANRSFALRAFVACERGSKDILGFYYLCATSVEHDAVDRGTGSRFVAMDKIPALYLGMIGVHKPVMRCGVGASLMKDAFLRVMEVANSVGVWALTLDAIDQEVARYYEEKFEFRRFADGGLEMYLPLGSIMQLGLD